MRWRSLLVLSATVTIAHAFLASLDSPSQAARDTAAAEIRRHYKPSPRARWEPLLAALKPGDSKQSIVARLTSEQAIPGTSFTYGGAYNVAYRLDDRWRLICWFQEHDHDKLLTVELSESVLNVWVPPPAGFIGTWTVYYANGQRSHEMVFKDGQNRVTTAFYDDGSICYIQRYTPKGIDGEEIGYYRSGKVNYRGMHKDGEDIGTWTWYNEDGSVKSTKQYDVPRSPASP